GRDGLLPGGGQSRYQRRRQPKVDRQTNLQPAVRRGRGAIAALCLTAVGPRSALCEFRGDRGTLQRSAQLRRVDRQPESGSSAVDVAVSAAGPAERRLLQKFWREGRPVRPE